MAVDRARVAELVRELLLAIGEDPERPGLVRTPERVAESYAEFFAGLGTDASAALGHPVSIARGPEPETLPTGAVILRGLAFRSVCEHHLLPFLGHAHIAYLPRDQVVGFGALPRLVETLAARPQVQERLGEQIADTIQTGIDARGVLVVLEAAHGCVSMRGPRQADASALTIAARGAFAEPAARAELIALIAPGAAA